MSKLSERRRDIKALDMTAAREELAKLRRTLFDLRFQKERDDVRDNRQFAKTRKDIARLLSHISDLQHTELIAAQGHLVPAEEGNQE